MGQEVSMKINYVKGDATRPEGEGLKYILHICNDAGYWGAGFTRSLDARWDLPRERYLDWWAGAKLGAILSVPVESSITVVSMMAQHGVGARTKPIRYNALRDCLCNFADQHEESRRKSVHAPKFGSGLAGGDWGRIENIIKGVLIARNIPVTIYEFD
jgi:O-acetyl-ADP-ribose deacetylase (regulator of RNase III)